MKLRFVFLASILAILTPTNFTSAQVTITGPSCVTTNTVYQYQIDAPWDSSFQTQLCVTGGVFEGSSIICNYGVEFSSAKVVWSDSVTEGLIKIITSAGEQTLPVVISKPLYAGLIDSAYKLQILDSVTIPSSIICLPATGGSCFPSYQYQWEKSTDGGTWEVLENATDPSLSFTQSPGVTMFFRRRTTEEISGTVGYSDESIIAVTTQN